MDKEEEEDCRIVSDSNSTDQPETSSRFTRSRTYSLDLYSIGQPRHSLFVPHAKSAVTKSSTIFHPSSERLAKIPLKRQYSIPRLPKVKSVPVSPVLQSKELSSSAQQKDSARKLIQNLVTIFTQTRSPIKLEQMSLSETNSPVEEVDEDSLMKALSEASQQNFLTAHDTKYTGGSLTTPDKSLKKENDEYPGGVVDSNSSSDQSDEDTPLSFHSPIGSPLSYSDRSVSRESHSVNTEGPVSCESSTQLDSPECIAHVGYPVNDTSGQKVGCINAETEFLVDPVLSNEECAHQSLLQDSNTPQPNSDAPHTQCLPSARSAIEDTPLKEPVSIECSQFSISLSKSYAIMKPQSTDDETSKDSVSLSKLYATKQTMKPQSTDDETSKDSLAFEGSETLMNQCKASDVASVGGGTERQSDSTIQISLKTLPTKSAPTDSIIPEQRLDKLPSNDSQSMSTVAKLASTSSSTTSEEEANADTPACSMHTTRRLHKAIKTKSSLKNTVYESDSSQGGVASGDLLTPVEDPFSSIGEEDASESTLSGEEYIESRTVRQRGRASKARKLVAKARQGSRRQEIGRRTRSGRNMKKRRISSTEDGHSPSPPPKRDYKQKAAPPKGNLLASILTDIPEVDICPLKAHKTTPSTQLTIPISRSDHSEQPKIKMYPSTKRQPSQSTSKQQAQSSSKKPSEKAAKKQSDHYKLLMRWEKDLNMGSNACTAPMLYAMEKLPHKLSAPGPWLEKAKMVWAVWRRGVKKEDKKVYLRQARDNRVKARQSSKAELNEVESESEEDMGLSPLSTGGNDHSEGLSTSKGQAYPSHPQATQSSQLSHPHTSQLSYPHTTHTSQPSYPASKVKEAEAAALQRPLEVSHACVTPMVMPSQSTHLHTTQAKRPMQPSQVELLLNTARSQYQLSGNTYSSAVTTNSKLVLDPLRMPVATIPAPMKVTSKSKDLTKPPALDLMPLKLPNTATISMPANLATHGLKSNLKSSVDASSLDSSLALQLPTFDFSVRSPLPVITTATSSRASHPAITAVHQNWPPSNRASPTKATTQTALPASSAIRSTPTSLPSRAPNTCTKKATAPVWSITTQRPLSKCPARPSSSGIQTTSSGQSKPIKKIGLTSRLSPHTPLASPTFVIPQINSLQKAQTANAHASKHSTQMSKMRATMPNMQMVQSTATANVHKSSNTVVKGANTSEQDSPKLHFSYVPPSMLRPSTHVSSSLLELMNTSESQRSRSVSVTSSRRSSTSPIGSSAPGESPSLVPMKQEPLSMCASKVEVFQRELPIVTSLNTHVPTFSAPSSVNSTRTSSASSQTSTPTRKSVPLHTHTPSTSSRGTPSQTTPTSPVSPTTYYNSNEYKLSIWKKIHELNQLKPNHPGKRTRSKDEGEMQVPPAKRRSSVVKSSSSISDTGSQSSEPVPMLVKPPVQFRNELESSSPNSVSTPQTPRPLTACSPELDHTALSPTDSNIIRPSLMVNAAFISDFSCMSLWEMEQLYAYNKAALYKQKRITKMIKAQLVKMQQEHKDSQNQKLSPSDLYKRFLHFVVEPKCTPDFNLSKGRASQMDILEDRCDKPVLKKEFDKYGNMPASGKA